MFLAYKTRWFFKQLGVLHAPLFTEHFCRFYVYPYKKVLSDKTYFGLKYVTCLQNSAHFRAIGPTPRSWYEETYLSIDDDPTMVLVAGFFFEEMRKVKKNGQI